MFGPTDNPPLGGVLVGGQSRRFGSDKAAAHVGDRSMAARAVHALRELSDPVVLLGGDGRLAERLALPWRGDARPGLGPLSGLATGLRWAEELDRTGLLVLACDLPLVGPEVMRAIASAARPDLDAVVSGTGDEDEPQPLCAWYGPGALPSIEDRLERGAYAVRGLLTDLRVAHVSVSDDPAQADTLLLNVNTPDDLEVARRAIPNGNGR
jgi:molybdopterin-guanine dinucleotide biosynthesis protein A